MIMQKAIAAAQASPATTITVSVPDHKELKPGTLLGIIRKAGLSRSLFES